MIDTGVEKSNSRLSNHNIECIKLSLAVQKGVGDGKGQVSRALVCAGAILYGGEMMNNISNKINIIRKILNEIERENQFTEILCEIQGNSKRDFKDCSPEQIYFDLIQYIVNQDDLPKNVCSINVQVDNNNQITRYEFISFLSPTASHKNYINIIWAE